MNNLLEDLKYCTEERDMEKKKVLWLAKQLVIAQAFLCPFQEGHECPYHRGEDCIVNDIKKQAYCWTLVAEKAVGEKACPKN